MVIAAKKDGFTINSIFIATGCACRPNVLEWCPYTSSIIFAAKNDICIAAFDKTVSVYRILFTIHAHSDEINSIKIARSLKGVQQNENLLCTTSNTSEFALWHIHLDSNFHRTITLLLRGRKESTNALAKGYILARDLCKILIATSEFDKISLEYYERTEKSTEIISTNLAKFNFPGKIILSFDLSRLRNVLIMAVGLSNGSVEFFCAAEDNPKNFASAIVLMVEHNTWIRSLAFKEKEEELLLATAADNVIKLWQLSELKKMMESDEPALKLTPRLFKTSNADSGIPITIRLDSILTGHEGFIQTMNWHSNKCEFLSSGSDRNITRWQFSTQESLWLPVSRLGEVGEDNMDYYDATYSPDGNTIISHSLFGAFCLWDVQNDEMIPKSHTIGGHFDSVNDLSWDPSGSYLLTCGNDKTTRIYSRLANKDIYFEIARPQVHGHSLSCLTSITSTIFVSGSEEKIFRIFQANASFARNFAQLTDIHFESSNLPEMAFQTELSLTNKQMSSLSQSDGKESGIHLHHSFTEPPREDHLSKSTLFPEIQKLYGHGYEVFSVACNSAGTIISTSCKASHPSHAAIFLWDTREWQQRNILNAHQLTVTRMAFSRDDKFLLSTSRDRTWTLFRNGVGPYDYSIYHKTCPRTSRHSRIIWDCAWSHDSDIFATASRDKTLNIWAFDDDEYTQENVKHVLNFTSEEAITAVDFGPVKLSDGSYFLAIGLDNGKIFILEACLSTSKCSILYEFSQDYAYSSTVTRIRFRPQLNIEEDESNSEHSYELAASSTNNVVKIYKLVELP